MKLRLHYAEMDTWLVEMRQEGEFSFEGDKDFSSPREFLQHVSQKQPPTISLLVDRVDKVRVNGVQMLTILKLMMKHEDAKVLVDPLPERKENNDG